MSAGKPIQLRGQSARKRASGVVPDQLTKTEVVRMTVDEEALARYGIPGLATGMLGVLGPMRMAYARTIPTVRFMADLLSGLVSETMVGENNE